jgi:hypothetical protein
MELRKSGREEMEKSRNAEVMGEEWLWARSGGRWNAIPRPSCGFRSFSDSWMALG